MCFSYNLLTMIHHFLKAESLFYIMMTVSILIAGDNRKILDQIGNTWKKIVGFCDHSMLYLICRISKDNLEFKFGISIKFWSSDVLL